jgi:hypothetical protein
LCRIERIAAFRDQLHTVSVGGVLDKRVALRG